MRFTDKGLQALKRKSQRYEIVEDGGTGLAVRVSERGVKSFSFLYRFGGKPKRLTLGIYRDPALEGAIGAATHDVRGLPYLTLADARIKLAEARKKRDSGIDPAADAVTEHRAERKAQTVGELIDAYLIKYARPNKRSAGEDERLLNKDVRPVWGDRKAASIRRQEVIGLLDGIVARGAPVTANRMLSVTRKMFRWAVRQGIISISPVQEIDAPGGRETARERALSDQEMGEFWRATELLGYPYGPLSRLLLVTGQRCSEVAGMRDSEMEDGAKLWTIPRERTKNKLTHEVPLSQLALDILASLPAPADDDNPPDCLFISGNRGDTPVRQFKDAKAKLDKLILAARREALRNAGEDPAKAAPMAHWTLHDLRRTMRTNLSKLRLDPEICERIINHVPAGVRRTYDVHAYREEKREALTAWAVRLQQILAAKPVASGKVVRMRPAAQ